MIRPYDDLAVIAPSVALGVAAIADAAAIGATNATSAGLRTHNAGASEPIERGAIAERPAAVRKSLLPFTVVYEAINKRCPPCAMRVMVAPSALVGSQARAH